jgi:hypothetical protein
MAVDYKRRITGKGIFICTGLGATVDLIQFILNVFAIGLGINRLLSLATAGAWFLFLFMKGISVISAKRLITQLAAVLGEEIPAVDTLPLWTFTIWTTLKSAKKEDDMRIAELEAQEQAEEQARQERIIAEQELLQ